MPNFLQVLAEQLAAAALCLEQEGGPRQQLVFKSWANHFRQDAKSVRLMAETYREPERRGITNVSAS